MVVGRNATEYFSRLTQNKLRRVRSGELSGITEHDCLNQEKFLHQVLRDEPEQLPFAIDHGDLAPLNIIVDSEHNITG
jgi:RIO-like serine/threonine protein kinase